MKYLFNQQRATDLARQIMQIEAEHAELGNPSMHVQDDSTAEQRAGLEAQHGTLVRELETTQASLEQQAKIRAAQEVKLEAVKEAAAAEVSEAIKDAKTPAEKIAIADQIIAENTPKPSGDALNARSAVSATKS